MKLLNTGILLIILSFISAQAFTQSPVKQPNVLFIMVDDLRPSELACYGNAIIKSPNIDALAAEGILFKRQYVTVPTCGASRNSILTGMLPRTKAELSNDDP